MAARIGLAIIGAGRMGRGHARLIAAGAPELRIVAIGDIDGAAARGLADEIGGATAFDDPGAAICAPGVDAVLIAVSSVHHRAIVEAAASAGRDILCEKPLALDLAGTDAILAAVARAGVRLQVGLMRRHDPDHVRARARIVAGELGRPLLFNSRQYDTDPPPPAILDPRISGGIMLDMGIHEFDSGRFLVGSEIVEVQATGSVQVYPEAATHGDVDTAVVNLRFASGAIGSVELSRRVAFGEDPGRRSTAPRAARSSAGCRSRADRRSGRRAASAGTRPRHRRPASRPPTRTRRAPSRDRSRTTTGEPLGRRRPGRVRHRDGRPARPRGRRHDQGRRTGGRGLVPDQLPVGFAVGLPTGTGGARTGSGRTTTAASEMTPPCRCSRRRPSSAPQPRPCPCRRTGRTRRRCRARPGRSPRADAPRRARRTGSPRGGSRRSAGSSRAGRPPPASRRALDRSRRTG